MAKSDKTFKKQNMKKKTQIKFKPFDRLEWNEVSEEKVKEVLDEDQFKTLNKDKTYKIPTGIFKIG